MKQVEGLKFCNNSAFDKRMCYLSIQYEIIGVHETAVITTSAVHSCICRYRKFNDRDCILQLAELFGRDVKTIGKHINNALKEELNDGISTVAQIATVQTEGTRTVSRWANS